MDQGGETDQRYDRSGLPPSHGLGSARKRHPRKAFHAMRLLSDTSSAGVREQLFRIGDIPGVLWTPDGPTAPRPLILLGHGGGRHKKEPDILARAHRFV